MNGAATRNGLPLRPSQDLGYSRGSQGGYRGMQNGYNSGGSQNERPSISVPEANGRTILEGYRPEIMNGFQGEKPRYNPLNASRPQSSMLLNVNDSIQVHLLVETALGDSKEFEVLSQEEVDDLKKQCQVLSQRIDQTRQNLAIQSKYRDAAISMAKLYGSPSARKNSAENTDGKKPRRSILGHKSSNSAETADLERMACERRCEELAAELWSLEKRLMEPQGRLLKHTAGILQMTHKGPKSTQKRPGTMQQNGIPGSPESMYTYSNARTSIEPVHDELLFDERSLYRSFDRLDGIDEYSGVKDGFGPPPKSQAREQMQLISKTEMKLENLNRRLRDIIIAVNPQTDDAYAVPPLSRTNSQGRVADMGDILQKHLDYLEKSIETIHREQSQISQSDKMTEETIEGLNREVRNLLLPYEPHRPLPPQLDGKSLKEQLLYFQNSLDAMELKLSRTGGSTSKSIGDQDVETVLRGVWDVIQSGEDEIRQRKLQRRQTRTAQGHAEDEDDSLDDGSDANEPFTLQGFSTKVQWLYTQATRLKDQKKVLQRQIKQQRELNNKSDATKDAEMAEKVEELERCKALLTRTETDADSVREQLSIVMDKLDEVKQRESMRDQAKGYDESATSRASQELDATKKTIADLEEQLQEMKDHHSVYQTEIQAKVSDSEAKIVALTTQIAAVESEKAKSDDVIKAREEEIEEKEQEVERMTMKIAELQTEVTLARAELDGAYGSRAQRAAEVAANPVIQKEIDDLNKQNAILSAELSKLKETGGDGDGERMRTLKQELKETIEEYEIMTKASIEWEKDREELDRTIDKLRDEREGLETQLNEERVKWMGMKSPGAGNSTPTGAGESTSTTVLKNEFKKMMRDTRAENAKTLRAEQAERRKLEDELRALKKLMGPGKSSLSQSMRSP